MPAAELENGKQFPGHNISALESMEGVHTATLGDSGEIVVIPERDKVVDFRTLADTTEAAGLARVRKMRVWAVGRVHNVAITRARIPFSKHPTRNLGIEPRIRIRGWPKYHHWHGHSFYDEQEFIANVDLSTQPPELLQLNG